jgi:predicted transcriptional regulator
VRDCVCLCARVRARMRERERERADILFNILSMHCMLL